MKIIAAHRSPRPLDRNLEQALASADAVPLDLLPVSLIADSAINRNNLPVFLPDFITADPGAWVAEVVPAIQIGRLGKFIQPKFARRHISSVLLAAWVRPAYTDAIAPLTLMFDGAFTRGIPQEDVDSLASSPVKISAVYSPLRGACDTNTLSVEKSIGWEELHAEEIVAFVSRFCTLKSGDIIIPASVGITFPAGIDMSLRACLNGVSALATRLK